MAKTSSGLDENVAGLLSYIAGWITGLIFFLIEKENKLVRFAAMQSIILNVALFVTYFIIGILGAVTFGIGAILSPLVGLGFVVIWIMLMVKAYQNEEWELPVIGKIARDVINK